KRPAGEEENKESKVPKKQKKKHVVTVLVPDFVDKLNEVLPPAIRVLGYIRTTNGFDSKNFCCARTYMYMLPTFAFAPIEKFVTDEYRVSPEIVEKVRGILLRFEGTHKFHNFTSGVKYEQARASRYIIKFECSDPYVREGLEFVTLKVKGQSFMLHHIRKMIGLTIAIVRGYCGDGVIDSCWGPEKVDVPKAPGLGLVLEQLHFDGYNKRFGSDGVHEPIDWSQYQETVEKFKEEQIISQIVVKEKTERVTFEWLRTLQFHNFDTPRLEGPQKPWVPVMKMLENEKKESSNSDGMEKDAGTSSQSPNRLEAQTSDQTSVGEEKSTNQSTDENGETKNTEGEEAVLDTAQNACSKETLKASKESSRSPDGDKRAVDIK
ncbi:tRNA pseudouridine synthase, partial [Elysia marginata]